MDRVRSFKGPVHKGFGLYTYVDNNPYAKVDPDGMDPVDGCAKFAPYPCDGGSTRPSKATTPASSSPPKTIGPTVDAAAYCKDSRGHIGSGCLYEIAKQRGANMGPSLLQLAKLSGESAILGLFGRVLWGVEASAASAAAGETTAAAATAKELNQIAHLFPRVEKNLGGLVSASGSELSALRSVQAAANEALSAGRLTPGANGVLPGGGAGAMLNVNGVRIQLIGGRVMNGSVEIGSFVGLP